MAWWIGVSPGHVYRMLRRDLVNRRVVHTHVPIAVLWPNESACRPHMCTKCYVVVLWIDASFTHMFKMTHEGVTDLVVAMCT